MKFFKESAFFLMSGLLVMPVMADDIELVEESDTVVVVDDDKRTDYQERIEARMDEVMQDLAVLEAKSKEWDRSIRRDFRDMRNDVTDDLRGLQDQWRDFSNKTDAQWETAKNRLDQSWEDFTTRYNQRKEQLLNKTQ
jgi:hypothetical protein